MKYQNAMSAVIRALAAETMSGVGGCDFEPKVQAAKLKGEIVGKDAAMLFDCWVHARLHSKLIPRHWDALVAKFSTHKGKKVEAIGKLVPLIASQAPSLFRYKAVTAWAIPPVKGVQVRSGHEVASRSARERAEFDSLHDGVVQHLAGGYMAEDAGQARREQYVKRSTDMIVLPAEFYDINTWDNQGLNRTTYWRWKKAIETVLEEMVTEALAASAKILQDEGVLMAEAA
ncbi:hypothetical protein IRZ53_07340 [Pseudomonas fulva]|uniref:hypothetical protein n=1 Tax=Pseudomonas fulva TaxID=47880 RepID=UPI0018A93890|nr:hypothetical protein [Pseudomonas fulva]MBF8674833.1 hypothetical protein [Pseudomonas fulva]MBF8696608.1 hypothetical protein [Pseudomonas fulva]